MGTKPKSSRQKPGRKSPSPGWQAKKKAKDRETRPHSILLADLFLWISVIDECLYHPTGPFDRVAKTEGYGSLGNVAQRLDVLESRFGTLFYRNKRLDVLESRFGTLYYRNSSSGYRSGVPTFRGAALAELFVVIELLYSLAPSLGKSGNLDELRKLKELVLNLAPRRARRVPDDLDQNRIKASLEWRIRQLKTGRPHKHKKMSDWSTYGPSPVRPQARLSSTSARSRS
jgi:hypothetical protein